MAGKRRIVWAVDPFGTEQGIIDRCSAAVKLLGAERARMVQLVHVIAPNESDRILSMRDRGFSKRYAEEIRERLLSIGRKARLTGLAEPAVLTCKGSSMDAAIGALISHARRARADFIVAGTHARKGPAKWVLGSFAEGLVGRSSVPVVVVGKANKR